jgi:hypothetical protein
MRLALHLFPSGAEQGSAEAAEGVHIVDWWFARQCISSGATYVAGQSATSDGRWAKSEDKRTRLGWVAERGACAVRFEAAHAIRRLTCPLQSGYDGRCVN